jgi:hypothetical protein
MELHNNSLVVTLPSNAHPSNRPSEFRTRLPAPMNLGTDWEVALYSIVYPRTWMNLFNPAVVRVKFPGDTTLHNLEIPAGHYESIQLLVRTISAAIDGLVRQTNPGEEGEQRIFNIRYHSTERRVYFHIARGAALMFDKHLAHVFGIAPDRSVTETLIGAFTTGLLPDVTAIYVYCDAIEAQTVGNTHSPLLQIVPVQGQFGDVILFSPRKLLYIPVNKKTISSIELELTDSLGESINFLSGQVVIQLHFRRRTISY